MDRRAAAIAELEAHLGHVFADRELLERALTHASVGNGSRKVAHNERLEFLGDRVLGLLAAETLVVRHPDWREGELSRRHATLVAGKTCAEVARHVGLPGALRLAGGASKQGGRDNDRILGDAMEALMAAVYLDGGLAAARAVFAAAWTNVLASAAAGEGREPKTALQEWAMAAGLPLPSYREVSRSGPDHAPLFVVEAAVEGYAPERAVGSSLREAEKAAALALLEREDAT
jgi:ribonuclease III